MNNEQLAERYPTALARLPAVYRREDYCEYFERDGVLYAKPLESERHALGVWESRWDPKRRKWSRS